MPISCLVTRSWRSIVCAAVGVIGVMFANASVLAQGPLPSGNLVFNPSAQNGTSGWSLEGQFSVRSLAMPGSPDSLSFWGGTSAVARGTQLISVENWGDKISRGCVLMTLSALLGGWAAQSDNATVRVDFLNIFFSTIGSVTIGPVSVTDRGSTTRMMHRAGAWNVPPGTSHLRVVVSCNRVSGTNNDGYADDISVVLTATSTAALPPDNFAIVQDSPAVAVLGGTMTLSAVDPNLFDQCGLYYQWYRNGSPMLDEFGNGRTVLGSKSASITIGPLTADDLLASYSLRVVPVSDGSNFSFSSPNLRVSQMLLIENECKNFGTPIVTPSWSIAPRGGNAILRATAPLTGPPISGGPVTYQWSRIYYPRFGPVVTIPLADGVSDGGQLVSGATTPTLRLSNLQHFSDGTFISGQGIFDFSVYRLSATTGCGTQFVNASISELDPAESGAVFVPDSSSIGGFITSGSSGGAVTGQFTRTTASGGGSTGGGFGFASASITATISPTPYGSLLEIRRSGTINGPGGGTVNMSLSLDVDERTVWKIDPSGASPDIVVGASPGNLSGVFSDRGSISIRASTDLQGTFVWRMAMARDSRIVDVPLGPFNDPRWEISRVNALGEEWFVPVTQSGNPPAIEVFGVQPTSTVGCGSQAFSLSAFTRRFPGLTDFSISGTATAFNPLLAPAEGTVYLAMDALDASEDSDAPVASVRFADSSSTGPGSLIVRAGSQTTSRTPTLSATQTFPMVLSRDAGLVQAASDSDVATAADARPLRALRIVSGYLPLQCAGQPSGVFEGVRFGSALLSGDRACRSDLNFDDVVDNSDFVVFAAAYSIFSCEEWEMIPGCASDLNDDQTVDNADFVLFANAYNDFLCP